MSIFDTGIADGNIKKIVRMTQLLDKDPAKLSHTMASMPSLVFISASCILGGLKIFAQFGDFRLMKIFLMNHLCVLPGELLLNFPRKFLNILSFHF